MEINDTRKNQITTRGWGITSLNNPGQSQRKHSKHGEICFLRRKSQLKGTKHKYCKRTLQRWGKCDTKMREKIPNALVQVVICSFLWCDFLGCDINAIRLWKRSWGSGSQVYRQQIAQINILADHNLRHKLSRNWRNARSNNKRLISHDQSSRCQQARHSYVTCDTRRPAKGTGCAGREWKGRQSRAVKVAKNNGTLPQEVETGLPVDGWATIAAGVVIAGTLQ